MSTTDRSWAKTARLFAGQDDGAGLAELTGVVNAGQYTEDGQSATPDRAWPVGRFNARTLRQDRAMARVRAVRSARRDEHRLTGQGKRVSL